MQKYQIQFTLHTHGNTLTEIRNAFREFGEELAIEQAVPENPEKSDFSISLVSEEPTAIFDICGQFGRIRAVKVTEIKKS